MAASHPSIGVDHVTVVPTNFEPRTDSEADRGDSTDEDEREAADTN